MACWTPRSACRMRADDDDVEIIRAAYRMIGHGLEARHLRAIRLGANTARSTSSADSTGPMMRHATPAGRRQAGDVLADVAQAARDARGNGAFRSSRES